ncbi:hypothetical protein FQR65_LT00871 [Abscondita terminalis]|nr:hypothetical protein FQR65_LT00871 [Abscondita terminalis]
MVLTQRDPNRIAFRHKNVRVLRLFKKEAYGDNNNNALTEDENTDENDVVVDSFSDEEYEEENDPEDVINNSEEEKCFSTSVQWSQENYIPYQDVLLPKRIQSEARERYVKKFKL